MLPPCDHLLHHNKLTRTECELCRSTKLKIFTRKRYFFAASLYLGVSGLVCYIRLVSHGLNPYLLLLLSALFLVSVIAVVRLALLAITRSEPTYKCRSCGYYDWLEV